MSLIKVMLSIASRGGFKLGTLIFTVSLFTASITTLHTLTASYSDNVELIQQIALTPRLSLDKVEGTMIETNVYSLNKVNVLLVAPSNVSEYLSIIGVRKPTENLGENEVIISNTLLHWTIDGTMNIEGNQYQILMSLNLPQDTVVLTSNSLNRLTRDPLTAYYSHNGVGQYSQAPASITLVKGIASEVQRLLSSMGLLFFASLAVMSIIQATYVFNEGRDSFKVFKALHSLNRGMTGSFLLVAFIVSGLTMVLGISMGIMTSAGISLIASVFIETPYVKPVPSVQLLWSLLLGFISIFLALSIGYIRGYRNVSVD
jgi:hypothetical protein